MAALSMIVSIACGDGTWATSANSSDEEKLAREKARGQLVSVAMSIMLNLVGWFMFKIKVKESLVVINYGFILGPVIGFLLDQAIGTDAGFSRWRASPAGGFNYTFSSLIGANFGRYIVTVLLDMFISNPLQDVLKRQAKQMGVIKRLTDNDDKGCFLTKYDNFVAINFPSILQSIVAVATFNAYTNETRFAWAYPSATLDRDLRIPPGTIMLATCIAAVLYLNFYTIMDNISDREYFDVNEKVTYVMFTIALLCRLSMTDSMEAPVAGEDDSSMMDSLGEQRQYLGFALFVCFVIYGFVYPLWTRRRMLCCCCYKDKSEPEESEDDTDHMIDHPEPMPKLSTMMSQLYIQTLAEPSVHVQTPRSPVKKSQTSQSHIQSTPFSPHSSRV